MKEAFQTIGLFLAALIMLAGFAFSVSGNRINLQTQSGGIAVLVDGKQVGLAASVNFIPGNGIMQVCVANPGRIDCTPSFNSALIVTKPILESGACTYLKSSNGTTAYTASLAAGCTALGPYKEGMRFTLNPDATCATGCSLNIDNNGIVAIKLRDTTTNPNGAFVKGQPKDIMYTPVLGPCSPGQCFVFVLME